MRIRSDFIPTAKAEARLIELGFVRLSRMSGSAGWGNSIELPNAVKGEFVYSPGNPACAGRLALIGE